MLFRILSLLNRSSMIVRASSYPPSSFASKDILLILRYLFCRPLRGLGSFRGRDPRAYARGYKYSAPSALVDRFNWRGQNRSGQWRTKPIAFNLNQSAATG